MYRFKIDDKKQVGRRIFEISLGGFDPGYPASAVTLLWSATKAIPFADAAQGHYAHVGFIPLPRGCVKFTQQKTRVAARPIRTESESDQAICRLLQAIWLNLNRLPRRGFDQVWGPFPPPCKVMALRRYCSSGRCCSSCRRSYPRCRACRPYCRCQRRLHRSCCCPCCRRTCRFPYCRRWYQTCLRRGRNSSGRKPRSNTGRKVRARMQE
jgi:hypothetical protein